MADESEGLAATEPDETAGAPEEPELSPREKENAEIDAELNETYDKIQAREQEGANPAEKADKATKEAAKAEKPKESKTDRGPDGKFKAKDGAEKDGQTPSKEGEPKGKAEGTAAESKAIARPETWSPEDEETWKAIPPEAQKKIAQREKDAHDQISRQGRELSAFKPIGELLAQRKDVFDRNGLSFDQGVKLLLDAQEALDRDPIKGLAAIAERYGISRQELAKQLGGSPQPGANGQQQPRDQYVAQLEAKIDRLENRLTAGERDQQTRVRQEQEAAQNRTTAEVNEWSKDKPHFAEVRQTMSDLILGAAQRGDSLTLDQAYERAIYAHPEIRERVTSEQRAAEEARRAEENAKAVSDAKRNEAINGGSPRGGRKAAAPFLSDEDLGSTYDRIVASR